MKRVKEIRFILQIGRMILMRISTYINILKELDSRADYERYKKAVYHTDGVYVWLKFK